MMRHDISVSSQIASKTCFGVKKKKKKTTDDLYVCKNKCSLFLYLNITMKQMNI